MSFFDHFFVIDWSSRAKPSPRKPSKDAIWLAEGAAAGAGRMTTKYFRTRQGCYDYVVKRLKALAARKKRVLVGWDFAFGYPKGLAKAANMKGKPAWRAVWKYLDKHIVDKADNHNNRFSVGGDLNRRITGGSGPFWGVPAGQSGVFLGAKKDFSYPVRNKRASLEERRIVERRVKRAQSPWKLAYTGSVGSQSLLGIPRLDQLLRKEPKLKEHTEVWPFTTRFADQLPAGAPLILHVEIYPSTVEVSGKDKILDRDQVQSYLKWLRNQQAKGRLAKLLAGPEDLTAKERKQAIRHEGWILGVK